MNALASAGPPAAGLIDPQRLPRLVYFADVTVENYMHGSALMYRLLESYPPDRLLVVESFTTSEPSRRLPGVGYRKITRPFHRLLKTRLWRKLSGLYALRGGDGAAALERAVGDFAPQAVLTVVHGFQWRTAAEYAEKHAIPLHLIAHDLWRETFPANQVQKAWIAPRFARHYRRAASRFCVSPQMAKAYEAETGAPAEVIYPARRKSFEAPTSVSPRVANPGHPFTVAYAGSISDPGLVAALEMARAVLAELGGQLLVFGPYSQDNLNGRGLAGENLVVGGLAQPLELAGRLRLEADALLASVSFTPEALSGAELCFPSKLTDYTAAGLPIVTHGPATSSAVRWARENPDVAAAVDSFQAQALRQTFQRLIEDVEWRRRLATAALMVGARDFTAERAEASLYAALAGPGA